MQPLQPVHQVMHTCLTVDGNTPLILFSFLVCVFVCVCVCVGGGVHTHSLIRASSSASLVQSHPMRKPGSANAFDSPESVTALSEARNAEGSWLEVEYSSPLYISSLNILAPASSHSSTIVSKSRCDGSAPVGLCGKLNTTNVLRPLHPLPRYSGSSSSVFRSSG